MILFKASSMLFLVICFLCSCTNTKKETIIDYWENSAGKKTHIKFKYELKNGKLDGYSYRFYDNGQLMSKAFYEDDRLLKIFCVYDSLGRELNYGSLDEKGTGYVVTYEDYSGRRGYSGYYINGRREGWWKLYSTENYVSDSVLFKNSFPDFAPTLEMVLY